MIVVRDEFHLKFGMAKDAKALVKEMKKISNKNGFKIGRFLTDFTGQAYRLILETEFKDLADYEKSLKEVFAAEEWQRWYQKFIPLVDSSEREILTVLEM
jgi:NIPSNAP